MDVPISAADWKTTEMIRAEDELYEAIDRADQQVAEAKELLSKLDAQPEQEPNGIEPLKAYALGPDAPEVLRQAIADVEAGRRARADALSDPAITADPVVMAALEAVTRPGPDSWPQRRATPRPDYDPDDFSTHNIMRNQ